MKKSSAAWLDFASRDLEAAKKLLDDEFVSNVVIFHSQQCVEKCLKAILDEYDQIIPKIHGVNKLYDMVTKNTHISLPMDKDDLDLIDDVYIDTRYPGNFGILPSGFPKKEEAELLLNIAERVYEATVNILNKEAEEPSE